MDIAVKVVIPVYKEDLSGIENEALINNINVLSDYERIFVCPEGLDVSYYLSISEGLKVERFPDYYFKSIENYNQLLVSSDFYSRFLDASYILICQTDAFVFSDDLRYWSNKGYDYIGAPWIGSKDGLVKKIIKKVKFALGIKKKEDVRLFKVGNGGFSLRKVQSFYNISKKYKDLITSFRTERFDINYHIEDVFWSFKAPELERDFKIPDYTEALSFAMDRRPALALKMNNGQMPFACHGINKPNVAKFWNPIIESYLTRKRID